MAEQKKFIMEPDPEKYVLIREVEVDGYVIQSYIHNLPPEETALRRKAIMRKALKILAVD